MVKKDEAIFLSEGDLKIAALCENLNTFYGIINPDLYSVLGKAPDQNIMFHNDSCFGLFLIRVDEVFSEGINSIEIDGKYKNISLLEAALWFCQKEPSNVEGTGLYESAMKLKSWILEKKPFEIWTGDEQVRFEMSRKELIHFGANLKKHNLLRLNRVFNKLKKFLKNSMIEEMPKGDIVGIIGPFVAEIESRLLYHSSYIVEMLYDYFLGINRVVAKQRNPWGVIDARVLKYPEGVTTIGLKELYSTTLAFRIFDEDRFNALRPETTRYLKLRY